MCGCKLVNNSLNSTCVVEYQYMSASKNGVALIAALQGPTEAKFASKQDASRTTIEVILKCANSRSVEEILPSRVTQKLRQDIKHILEQIVQTIAYPRTLLTFTLSIVSCANNSELNLMPACVNACICLLNRAGINQK